MKMRQAKKILVKAALGHATYRGSTAIATIRRIWLHKYSNRMSLGPVYRMCRGDFQTRPIGNSPCPTRL